MNFNPMYIISWLFFTCNITSAAPQLLVDADFGNTPQNINIIDPEKRHDITGFLPENWNENTSWRPDLTIRYTPMNEDGKKFLRLETIKGSYIQVSHEVPQLEETDGYYKLKFNARSIHRTTFTLAIRQMGAPYLQPWRTSPTLTENWQEFTTEFRLDKQSQRCGIFLYVESAGSVDLKSIQLERLTQEDMIEQMRLEHPEGGGENLVSVSRFPLGLQPGWNIDRDFSDIDEVQVVSDPENPGPSGIASLKITADKNIRLYTAPFAVPWSFTKHTISLWAKGSDSLRLQAVTENRWLDVITYDLSPTEWKRCTLTFTPLFNASLHSLLIDTKGPIWIDSLQVHEGDTVRDYRPMMPTEVNLALPESSASQARVQFTDEPAIVRYAVVDAPTGAHLVGQMINLYGDTKPLPTLELNATERIVTGEIQYDAFADRQQGAVRVEVWVEDAAGNRCSPANEIIIYRLQRPHYWGQDAPDSFFGTHVNPATRHLLMTKAIGCNWVRLHDAGTQFIGWAHLEPRKGEWHFYDREIERYRSHNLKILGLLSTAPGWATAWGKEATGYFERYMEPLDLNDWANYVRTTVDRYKGVIDSYEIWNEPWGTAFWSAKYDDSDPNKPFDQRFSQSETAPEDYARLMKSAYDTAKSIYPEVKILGFNSFVGEVGTNWTKRVLDAGGLEGCDIFSYHHYASGYHGYEADNTEIAYQDATQPLIEQFGKVPKPVWMSEGNNTGTDLSWAFWNHLAPDIEQVEWIPASNRLVRYILGRMANGEDKAFIYSMHCFSHGASPASVWSCFVAADGYLNPSAAAHAALAWQLEDTKFVERVEIAPEIWAYFFTGESKAVAAICVRPGTDGYALPTEGNFEVFDLYGNPLPAGAIIDENVAYVVAPGNVEQLREILGEG